LLDFAGRVLAAPEHNNLHSTQDCKVGKSVLMLVRQPAAYLTSSMVLVGVFGRVDAGKHTNLASTKQDRRGWWAGARMGEWVGFAAECAGASK
jgi:hypothetical protein